MAYQVLARKWRPRRFQDVIGQDHITKTLQNSLKTNRLGHAYLLTGTRGIGKTSIARIFAKSLRCESRLDDGNPCGKCNGCIDFDSGSSLNFIEVDGASHNSVDNIRDLVGNVQYLPTSGQYKIYIIDEVHMLSSSAFNALLKTLEEPPAHVIFIFATTEPHKLLDTVLSRCQRFDFRNATVDDLIAHIQEIAKTENITFENDKIIKQICLQGRGSVRDTLSLLDQVLSFSTDLRVDEETVAISLGLARTSVIAKICEYLIGMRTKEVTDLYFSLLEENISVKNIATSMLNHIYEVIENIDNTDRLVSDGLIDPQVVKDISAAELIWIFETISKDTRWILDSLIPDKAFVLLLQKIAQRRDFLINKPTASSQEVNSEIKKKSTDVAQDEVQEAPVEAPPIAEKIVEEKVKKSWDGFLSFLKTESPGTITYLMHSNLINPVDLQTQADVFHINLGFKMKDQVMYDYLNDKEMQKKLTGLIERYIDREGIKVELTVELVDKDEKQHTDFKSVAEIDKEKQLKEEEEKRVKFLNHPNVIEAQRIFNTSVDKVVLLDPSKIKKDTN